MSYKSNRERIENEEGYRRNSAFTATKGISFKSSQFFFIESKKTSVSTSPDNNGSRGLMARKGSNVDTI